MSLNEQVNEARRVIGTARRDLMRDVATMPSSEIKDFINAHKFLGVCNNEIEQAVDTGAMRDANEWVHKSGVALFRALTTPEFQALDEAAKIAYATMPKGGVYAVPVEWILEQLQKHPADGHIHLDEATIERIKNPSGEA
jgi:hypothetical protein